MSQVKTESHEVNEENKFLEAKFYAEHAARVIQPPGSEWVGSFNVHVYKGKFSIDNTSFDFATQFIGDVPESLAIEAAKEFKTRIMAKYGHTLKTRK